ncbi:MAG TPA: glycosyltransferase family 39 protein [Patescibacteria group bacterium]|nr:glycosyltransferase family 39 protein [Patescibacteria group bacterium]
MDEPKTALREKKILVPLILILILGAALRFHGIEYQSLSNDELSSWKRSSYSDLPAVINEGVRPDVHPPGYQVLLFFAEKIFGDSELALRFPSALFGVLSILAIFLIGLRLYTYREAILSSALMAVLWCPVFYSQDARSYAMLLFFTLLSSYCWMLMVDGLKSDNPRRGPLIAYAVTAAVCAYTHYFGTYLIALQGIFTFILFIRKRRVLLGAVYVYLAIAVVYLPWLPIMREHLARGPIWIETPRGGFVHWLLEFLRFIFNDSATVRNIALVFLLLLFARTYGEFAQRPTRSNLKRILASPGAVLLLWLVVPFAGVYFKSIYSAPILSVRNLIISLPPACLLLARAVLRIPVRSIIHTVAICLITALLVYHLVFPMEYYSRITKDQFRAAVQYLLDAGRIDRCSLIVANTNQDGYFDYYFEHLGSDRRVDVHFRSEDDWSAVKNAIDARNVECLWYFRASGREEQQHMTYRKEGFELAQKEYFLNVEVRLYRKQSTRREPVTQRIQTPITGDDQGPSRKLWERAMEQAVPEEKIKLYREIVSRYPDDQLAPQALYMIGFIYAEELQDTLKAQNALEDLIIQYPESSLIESARWMIGTLNGNTSIIELIEETDP